MKTFKIFTLFLIISTVLQKDAISADKPKVVVIGAGLAGLTSAYRLNQQGIDVQVYEARPRVGGRVYTVNVKNMDGEYSLAELGGQNILDGGEANNILNLIKELGIEITEDKISGSRLFFDGEKIHKPDNLPELQSLTYKDIEEKLGPWTTSARHMGDVLNTFFENDSIFKRMFAIQIAAYDGSSPKMLARNDHNLNVFKNMLFGWLSGAYSANGQAMIRRIIVKNGNAQIPLAIAQKLEGKIYLNKVLIRVEEEKRNKLKLSFKDGETVICDKLILSIPCSTYENINFDPKIFPNDRLETIKKIQYGSNGKIIIPSKHTKDRTYASVTTDEMVAFDNADMKLLNLYVPQYSGETLLKDKKKHFEKSIKALKAGFSGSTFNESIPIEPNEKQLDKYDVPVVKSWFEDPYAKGSYSNYGTSLSGIQEKTSEYKSIKVREIFLPIGDIIFFAGEHATMLDEIGTMEAAVESGELVSKQITALFLNNII